MVIAPGQAERGRRGGVGFRTVTETFPCVESLAARYTGMKQVSGLHVVSGQAGPEEEPLPPKDGTPGNGARRQPVDRSRLTGLLKERRYEEALEMLVQARHQAPDDPTVSRSIRLLKDKLTVRYAEMVGSLDDVTRCTIPEAGIASLSLSFEERGVLALVDGIATLGDVVDASTHGKFATYRALARFLEKGILARGTGEPARPPTRFADPPPAPPPPAARESDPPVPEDTSTLRATWEDIEDEDFNSDPRENTQPMFEMAALAAAGAISSTLAPPAAVAPAPAARPPAPLPAAEGPAPVSSEPGVDYESLFERATRAYVRRSYDEAMKLFEECLEKRPDDRRAIHNLEQLRKRKKGS